MTHTIHETGFLILVPLRYSVMGSGCLTAGPVLRSGVKTLNNKTPNIKTVKNKTPYKKRPMQQNAQLQNAQCYKTSNVTKRPMQQKAQNKKRSNSEKKY